MPNFTTTPGRFVSGDMYKPKARKPQPGDDPNKPRTPMVEFGIAIPKIPGQHWGTPPANFAQTYPKLAAAGQRDGNSGYWGEIIWKTGVEEFGQGVASHASFAWKITDGDATEAKTAGAKAPADNENFRGHWVLWFSAQTPPEIWDANTGQRITDVGAVKPGFYVQVAGNVRGNGNKPGNPGQKKSGVYLNHSMVGFLAYGPEIVNRPDFEDAGFGGGPLPPGATTTPTAAMGGAPAPMPAAPAPQAAAPLPGPTPVAPLPGAVPTPQAAAPAPLPVAPPPRQPVLVPSALAQQNGWTIEALRGAGHTDDVILANGWGVMQ